jgi:hypothetical protein
MSLTPGQLLGDQGHGLVDKVDDDVTVAILRLLLVAVGGHRDGQRVYVLLVPGYHFVPQDGAQNRLKICCLVQ